MAIAVDTTTKPWATNGWATNTFTVSHTCSGTNRAIIVNVGSQTSVTWVVTWVTYAWVSLTKWWGETTDGSGNSSSAWVLANPASWANNVVITTTSSGIIYCEITSYTWVNQASPVGAVNTTWPTTTTSFTQTLTTTQDNSWLVMCGKWRSGNTVSAGANTFIRVSIELVFTWLFIADSNSAQTPTGSKSLNVTSSSQEFNGNIFELKSADTITNSNFFAFF